MYCTVHIYVSNRPLLWDEVLNFYYFWFGAPDLFDWTVCGKLLKFQMLKFQNYK